MTAVTNLGLYLFHLVAEHNPSVFYDTVPAVFYHSPVVGNLAPWAYTGIFTLAVCAFNESLILVL